MTRRNELTDLANALLGTFVSRNNDVNGYWAIGQLRSLADNTKTSTLRFDILRNLTESPGPLLEHVTLAYHRILAHQLNKRRVPLGAIHQAEIILTFSPQNGENMSLFVSYGDPLLCTVFLVDNRAREYRASIVARCAPHDPLRELRSTRT